VAFLALVGSIGVIRHVVVERRKGYRAVLIYGPIALAIVIGFGGLFAFAMLRPWD
jgi:hypothetical protein